MNLKNILIAGLAGALMLLLGLGLGLRVGGNNQSVKIDSLQVSINEILAKLADRLGGITNFDSLTLGDNLVVSGTSSFTGLIGAVSLTSTGTTTTATSPDGFVAQADFSIATGTAKAVYTNSKGQMYCDGATGMFYALAGGSPAFAPSLAFALGTTTTATGYATNLMASTTVATSTKMLVGLSTHKFILNNGESIVGAISDTMATGGAASSTYYGNWTAEFSIDCRAIND